MRKFVIGDIRGEVDLLEKLLDKIQPAPPDNVIFLGSYIGPGKNSKGTVERLLVLKKAFPDVFYFVGGCYEMLFGEVLAQPVHKWKKFKLWWNMGGNEVLKSYIATNGGLKVVTPSGAIGAVSIAVPEPHLRFFEQLPLWYEDTVLPFVASHSGISCIFRGATSKELCLFGSDQWWEDPALRLVDKDILFSHVPFKEPYIKEGRIGIDLGAGLGGRLCAIEMFSKEFTIVE